MSDALTHVCGLVAYDGTDYHGFQLQAGVPTIQGTLEAALQTVTGTFVRVAGSGRTDTGVHAAGQVIAMRLPWRHPVESLQRALNVNLPPSVTVRGLQLAPDGFHPRFSAVRRTYRYTVYDLGAVNGKALTSRATPKHSPLTDRFALYVPAVLDVETMNRALSHLLGEHDFATFGQPPQGEITIRQLHQAEWQVVETTLPPLRSYPGRCLVFTVCANAFLRQMVRNLVGVALAVGRGEWGESDLIQALAARDRSRCTPPAPPHGLVLETVTYGALLPQWPE